MSGLPTLPSSSDQLAYRDRLAAALGDDYELGELIGAGSFGEVYRAHDRRLDRTVAVKALRHDVFPTPLLLQRFDREVKAVAKLRHPNILPVFSVGGGAGLAYMVMPLVEGETLQARMDREGPLPPAFVARVIAEAAAALEAAHRIGLVHRDVKPANILLEGPEERALLVDFGVARSAQAEDPHLTATSVILGSPLYMSPEQAYGEETVDGRSDVFSLGAVAYEALAGRPPFEARNVHELVYRMVTQDPPDLSAIAPAVPLYMARAVMKCLAKDREQRWQTAADLRRALSPDTAASVIVEEYGELEGESWLSRRGPYVGVLLAALYVLGLVTAPIQDLIEDGSLLEYGRTALLILLAAALGDATVRVAYRLLRGYGWLHTLRFLLGQPAWWQTWYPGRLRVPHSIWDRLPRSLQVLRTLLWLELILVPAGGVLTIFVIPTFTTMLHSAGMVIPFVLTALTTATTAAAYALPVTVAWLRWEIHRWSKRANVPAMAFLASLFTLRGSDWQSSPARAMLQD